MMSFYVFRIYFLASYGRKYNNWMTNVAVASYDTNGTRFSYLKLKIVFEQIHVKYNDPLKLCFKEADQYVPKSVIWVHIGLLL